MRILLVEDEFLVAVQLEDELRAAGCTVVGPFTTLACAAQAARRELFDLAILDFNLNGEMVGPLAEELLARNVPFLFLTGYAVAELPERYRRLPRVSKPYDPAVLLRVISTVASRAG